MAIALRFAALSDVGLVRSNNQDSAYAGPHLLVVADGMGGHAGGDVASSLAIGELAPLDDESHGADALDHLREAIVGAHNELLDRVDEEPELAGMGTTVTALLRSGSRFALAHIGDSRGYLLRDAEFIQLTKDHTFVQTLVDEGRITAAEAEFHPQRSVLMRVLSDVVDDVEPDLSMREAHVGDRYLLCSDGLSSFVSTETLAQTLAAGQEPTATCEALVALAMRAGAPDNVTCIVADVVDDIVYGDLQPYVVGSAALNQPRRDLNSATSAAERAAALTAQSPNDGPLETIETIPTGRRRGRTIGGAILAVLLLIGGGFGAWRWIDSQFFVGTSAGSVAVYTGIPQNVGPLELSRLQSVASDVPLTDLPDYARSQLQDGVPATSEAAADKIVTDYRVLADRCRALASASASASASATVSPTASPSPSSAPEGLSATTVSATPGAALASAAAPTVSPTLSGESGAAEQSVPSSPTVSPTQGPAPSATESATSSDCAGLAP